MKIDFRNVLVIINPASGKRKAARNNGAFVRALQALGATTDVRETAGIGDAQRIAAREGKAHDLVIACGGDGTLSEVISGLLALDSPPPVGFFPSGSTCDVARTFHLSRDPEDAASDMLSGRSFPLDIGLIRRGGALNRDDERADPAFQEGDAAGHPKHFTYVAAYGAFTEVSYATSRALKQALGHAAYVLKGIGALSRVRPIQTTVILDGRDYSGAYLFGGVVNSRSVGGIVPLPGAALNDGAFDAVLVSKPPTFFQLCRLVLCLLRGKEDPHLRRIRTKQAVFHFDSPVPFTVDGESGGAASAWSIENLPRAVALRIPPEP